MNPISKKLAEMFLNMVLTGIENFGGKCPNDERCRDLYEALERFIRDAMASK